MIRSLRRRHGAIFWLLAVALPLTVIAALVLRRAPLVTELPAALAPYAAAADGERR